MSATWTIKPYDPAAAPKIVALVCNHFDVTEKELRGTGRSWRVAYPRFICSRFLKSHAQFTHAQIDRYFKRKTGSANHALRALENLVQTDAVAKRTVEELRGKLNGKQSSEDKL